MNEEEIRNIIKSRLQNLSKEQLIDNLTDIYMETTAIRMMCNLSSVRCTNIRDDIKAVQRIDDSFAILQQQLGDLVKQQTK